jgi:hypothetical protein
MRAAAPRGINARLTLVLQKTFPCQGGNLSPRHQGPAAAARAGDRGAPMRVGKV